MSGPHTSKEATGWGWGKKKRTDEQNAEEDRASSPRRAEGKRGREHGRPVKGGLLVATTNRHDYCAKPVALLV